MSKDIWINEKQGVGTTIGLASYFGEQIARFLKDVNRPLYESLEWRLRGANQNLLSFSELSPEEFRDVAIALGAHLDDLSFDTSELNPFSLPTYRAFLSEVAECVYHDPRVAACPDFDARRAAPAWGMAQDDPEPDAITRRFLEFVDDGQGSIRQAREGTWTEYLRGLDASGPYAVAAEQARQTIERREKAALTPRQRIFRRVGDWLRKPSPARNALLWTAVTLSVALALAVYARSTGLGGPRAPPGP